MEFADVEILSDLAPRAIAQFFDFKFADLVGQRLTRHRDVTIDLVHDVILGLRRVLHEEIDRALPVPFHLMHSRVDDEADRATSRR